MSFQNYKNYSQFEDYGQNEKEELFITPFSVLEENRSANVYLDLSCKMRELLVDEFGLVESRTDKQKKEDVLLKLNDILKNWMEKVNSMLSSESDDEFKQTARLLCFGSYKLGVSTPSGDIDALVLAPSYVKRNEHFFGTLFEILQEVAQDNDQITDLTFVNYKHSITPLIKMEFYGVSVDLVFAHIDDVCALDGKLLKSGLSDRPNLINNQFLKKMDDKMQRSYNGFRNAEMILNSIIKMGIDSEKVIIDKIDRYRVFLRCVKLWSKKKGINENKFGYLGGISYALLTAKIFQLYPFYDPIHLLERFFWIYGNEWDWDKWPVRIVPEIQETFSQNQKNNNIYKLRFMYIMTPAWPQMNSSHNVSYSTREIMLKAMRQSHTELSNISPSFDFLKFYKSFDFFKNHQQFIEINITGNNEEEFLFYKGFIEAKLRILTEEIEKLMNYYDFILQIWPKVYSSEDLVNKKIYNSKMKNYELSEKIYFGLSLELEYELSIILKEAVKAFLKRIEDDWEKSNSKRDPKNLNLFIYILQRGDVFEKVLSKETDQVIEKREFPSVFEDKSSKPIVSLKLKKVKMDKRTMDDLFD